MMNVVAAWMSAVVPLLLWLCVWFPISWPSWTAVIHVELEAWVLPVQR